MRTTSKLLGVVCAGWVALCMGAPHAGATTQDRSPMQWSGNEPIHQTYTPQQSSGLDLPLLGQWFDGINRQKDNRCDQCNRKDDQWKQHDNSCDRCNDGNQSYEHQGDNQCDSCNGGSWDPGKQYNRDGCNQCDHNGRDYQHKDRAAVRRRQPVQPVRPQRPRLRAQGPVQPVRPQRPRLRAQGPVRPVRPQRQPAAGDRPRQAVRPPVGLQPVRSVQPRRQHLRQRWRPVAARGRQLQPVQPRRQHLRQRWRPVGPQATLQPVHHDGDTCEPVATREPGRTRATSPTATSDCEQYRVRPVSDCHGRNGDTGRLPVDCHQNDCQDGGPIGGMSIPVVGGLLG